MVAIPLTPFQWSRTDDPLSLVMASYSVVGAERVPQGAV